MKREQLQEMGLTKEQIDTIMAENGKDVEAVKTTLAAKEQELATSKTEAQGLKDQIKQRDTDIADLKKQAGNTEELNGKITALQTKYDTDTQQLTQKLTQQELAFATEKFFANVPFASELARKAAVADFATKGFKYENGKFVGADGYVEELKKTDPAAFKPDDKPADNNPPPPRFSNQMNNTSGAPGKEQPQFFQQGFNYVRQPPQQQTGK